MSEELKPCPFCGSTDIYHEHNEITECYELGCNQCGAWPYQEGRKDDVVRKWNTRVERTCWRVGTDIDGISQCSECDALLGKFARYCPNCGARVVEHEA